MRATLRWLPLLMLPLALGLAPGCGSKEDQAKCGNGTCEAGEDATSCAADCQDKCGNGTCDPGEDATSCAADCQSQVCNNDGTCDFGEDQNNCPNDCQPVVVCNKDGTCDANENAANCPEDCAGNTCNNNGTCDAGETTASCPADCPTSACDNDGLCEDGESAASCPADCPDNTCDLVHGAENLGAQCDNQPQGFCGNGVCVSFDQNTTSTCAQACVPNACSNTCQGSERCFGVKDANGNPILIQPGVPLGACGVPPTGNQGAYDKCGAGNGACQAGLDCLGLPGMSGGMCLPQCTNSNDCPARESFAAQCNIAPPQASSPTNCGIPCDSNKNPPCPTGMTCQSNNLCTW